VFPNKGIYIKPISFTKILDKDGNVIFENKPEKSKVLSEQVSYLMVDIMKGVVRGGTGGNAALSRMPVAGKTGTTTKNVDAWFTGYSPYYTTSVWIGHDEPKPMNFTGGSYPAKIWKVIMEEAHKNLKVKDFERPGGLVSVDICTLSGQRPSELCALDPRGSHVRSELFIKGTEPAADNVCTVHVIKDVDIETGKLATQYCPSPLVQSKVFVQRPEPFIPQPGQTQVPADLIYEAPTEYCDKHTEFTQTTEPKDPLEGELDLEGGGGSDSGDTTPTPDEGTIEPTPTNP
jgi:penicillin-binding protein 1A